MTQEEITRQPRRFGKSTFVTNQFLASCEANESVEYRHPKYICMSLKRYNEIQSQTKKDLLKVRNQLVDMYIKHKGVSVPNELADLALKLTERQTKKELVEKIKRFRDNYIESYLGKQIFDDLIQSLSTESKEK